MPIVYRSFKQFKPTALVLFINLILYLPLAVLQRPLWDGALSSYAREESYKYLNLEAIDYSFPTQYFPEIVINFIAVTTHINFYVYYWILVCVTLTLIYKSLQILSILLNFNSFESIQNNRKSVLFFVFFPAFHVLFSTQNFIWIVCLAFCLWGVVFLLSNKSHTKILGVLFVLISFQMASLPFLFLFLFSSFFMLNRSLNFVKVFLISAFFCTIYLIVFRRLFFEPAGIYENYNSVTLNFETLPILLGNSLNFTLFIVPLIAIYSIALNFGETKKMLRLSFKQSQKIIFLILLMVLACIFPYIMALKSPSKLDLFDWSFRHALITIVPLMFYIFWASDRFEKIPKKSARKSPAIYIFALVIYFLSATYGHVQSMVFDKSLILELNNSKTRWSEADLLCFDFNSRRLNSLRFYELNEIVWQVTGNTNIQSDSAKGCSTDAIKGMNFFSNPSVSDINETKWQNIYIGGLNKEKMFQIDVEGRVGLSEIYRGFFYSDFDNFNLFISDLDHNAS